jgi:hypothetical protein
MRERDGTFDRKDTQLATTAPQHDPWDAALNHDPWDAALNQLYHFFMEGRMWTPKKDLPAYLAWHKGVPDAKSLPDYWEATPEPEFLLWLLGRVWVRGLLLRPWRAWYGLKRFIEGCVAAARLDARALDAQQKAPEPFEVHTQWFDFDGPSLISRARRAAVRATERLARDPQDAARVRGELAEGLRWLVENPFTEQAGFIIPNPAPEARVLRDGDRR